MPAARVSDGLAFEIFLPMDGGFFLLASEEGGRHPRGEMRENGGKSAASTSGDANKETVNQNLSVIMLNS
jgi:hypothetical protein